MEGVTDCHVIISAALRGGGVMWRAMEALDLSSPPLHYKQLRGEQLRHGHENGGERGTERKQVY